jgi:hypothetical protein
VKKTLKYWHYLVLALISFFAHYVRSLAFGLYEDDILFVGQGINYDWSGIKTYVAQTFAIWPQGRPIGLSLAKVWPFVGERLFGHLWGQYVVAFLLLWITCILVYKVALKLSGDINLSLLTAILFSIWPADTNRQLLDCIFILYSSLIFFFLFCLLYLRDKKGWALFFLSLSLITYESNFLIAFGFPLLTYLLDGPKSRERLRTCLLDCVKIGVILVVYGIIRKYQNESRVVAIQGGLLTNIHKVILSSVLGPITTLSAPFRFHRVQPHPRVNELWQSFFCAFVVFCTLGIQTSEKTHARRQQLLKVFLWGAFACVASYPLFAFSPDRYPPTTLVGRLNTVHISGLLGVALMLSSLVFLLLDFLGRSKIKVAVRGIVAVAVAYFVILGMDVQADYAASWNNQKARWSKILEQVPRFKDGDTIFVRLDNQPDTYHIQSFSWGDPLVLDELFQFPADWKTPPRVFGVYKESNTSLDFKGWGYGSDFAMEGKLIRWQVPPATWTPHEELLNPQNMTLLDFSASPVRPPSIQIHGDKLPLAVTSDGIDWKTLPQKRMYTYILGLN